MFLTSLTLRGFKSFADATTLEVEPGVTVIVGPNGSGKSNVVDGLAWVLGTGSAKRVRGGSMSDVIFAGSPSRAALGQARVEISIDNADGRLGSDALGVAGAAQEFREVRVSRTIFPTGENVYAVNGHEVRALDVQELLSDTGLGKELHTIVGQGQLDEILQAKPEERRRYIEEAAGILKHRRRRERSMRKLDQVDEHIEKLLTVLRELRRQLRPLERQAEAADKARRLQAELRTARLRLAAHDLGHLDARLDRQGDEDEAADEQLATAERQLTETRGRQSGLEEALAEVGPAADRAQQARYRFGTLVERLRSAAELVDQRRRHLLEYVEEPLAGRDPGELRAHADRLEESRAQRQQERDDARTAMEGAAGLRREADAARREHERRVEAARRRAAEARERVVRWEGEVHAVRSRIATGEAEVGRLAAQLTSLDDRASAAADDVEVVQHEIQQLDADEVALTDALEAAEREVERARDDAERLEQGIAELERERSGTAARAEVLRAALDEREGGAAALVAAGDGGSITGVLGPVSDLVRVEEQHAVPVAAALGALGEAVVVSTIDAALEAIGWLRRTDVGAATVVPADGVMDVAGDLDTEGRDSLSRADAIAAGTLLVARDSRAGADAALAALRRALAGTWVVGSWDAAVRLHARLPWATFVTVDGDVAGPDGYRGGERSSESVVATSSAAEEAETVAVALAASIDRDERMLAAARARTVDATAALKQATATINESDARITAAAERLARLHKEQNALVNQRGVVVAQHDDHLTALERHRDELSALEARGPATGDRDVDPGAGTGAGAVGEDDERLAMRLDEDLERAREHELEARVRLERVTEQVRHLELQAEELRDEADEVERALAAAAVRRDRRRAGIVRCGELAATIQVALAQLERTLTEAVDEHESLGEEVRERRQQLQAVRAGLGELESTVAAVRDRRQQAQMRRHELVVARDQLVERIGEQFGVEPAELLTDQGDAVTVDRAGLVETEDVLVRRLGLLGRINPLALEEFKALEDRHSFLAGQLDDLRRSKRDLEEVVVAVDDRIREVFRDAYQDVAREFERIFQVVFPGGDGRLVLTDPDDMLTTGIEVEARPPGKRVARLSLLSGGERSLTVLAFVFAIFRARPSPFYVLDEVDAALDDVNLQRLLRVIESFRGHSQIIMVTHQKRSMEVADLLYGITMNREGVTKVVADRLGDDRLELEPNLPAPV